MNQYKYKRIFIIGHPGAGKALFAKTLADKLGWKFLDADFGLEFRIGRKLEECLGDQGEQAFYNCQFEILSNLLTQQNIVVTTDASIACNERDRKILSSELVVYLQVSLPIQLERLARNPKPLLSDKSMEGFLDQLHRERDELYNSMSAVVINSDNSALEEHVSTILDFIDSGMAIEKNQPILTDKELILFHKQSHQPIRLSNQQALCLKLMAEGKASKEIAKEMNISYRTVEGHLAKTMELLGCSSSKELISLYFAK